MKSTKKLGVHKDSRANFLIVFLFVGTAIIGYRLFNLTFIQHDAFAKSAQNQYVDPSELISGRGAIYTVDGLTLKNNLVAGNKDSHFVYINAKKVAVDDDLITKLAGILNVDVETIKVNFLSGKSYQVIAKNVTDQQARDIKSLSITGLTVAPQTIRYYPNNTIASHVIGFVGFQGTNRVGQYGVEASYDKELNGNKNTQRVFGNSTYSSIKNFFKFGSDNEEDSKEIKTNQRGDDVILTIDSNVQEFIESKLDELVKAWSASGGTIIVQDPSTGAIIAMASRPNYNPNSYGEYKLDSFINPAVQEVFEPGSTFKAITMATGIDSGAITPDTTYEDKGFLQIGNYKVSTFDGKPRGIQTMREALGKSLNTGTVFAQEKTGNDAFLNHVVAFGFGNKSGIDLKGEVSGSISNLYDGRRINFATASFGQGISVSSIQLINAFSAIANGGTLMKPYVVSEVRHVDGSSSKTKPEILNTPIKAGTSTQIISMLVSVVDDHYTRARVSGYDIAAKTGTAQIADSSGGYLENDVIHDIVGFAPAYSAKFTILIKLDKPQGVKYSETSLTGTLGDITRFLLRYYNIPPTRQ